MKEYNKALHSRYIIDGVQLESTPYELLAECSAGPETGTDHYVCEESIMDEQLDPPLSSLTCSDADFESYLQRTSGDGKEEKAFPISYPEAGTRMKISEAVISTLWLDGHFKSGNIALDTRWTWNEDKIGNMAAFYKSVYATNEYLFDMGIRINGFSYTPTGGDCKLSVSASVIPSIPAGEDEDDPENEELTLKESPYKSRHAWTDNKRSCPSVMECDPESWIIYIPFDTCTPKLGASLLSQTCGFLGESAPEIQDPDYTVDCYEVVRELVEDKIVIAGRTVSEGGLATALKGLCGDHGMEIGLGGLKTSYPASGNTQILFSEIPGVLVQIRDIDYDYVDAQFLLQDVAYYPLGHPDPESGSIRIAESNDSDVSGILQSLLDQASEGED